MIAKADTLTPDECAQFKKRVSGMSHFDPLTNNIVTTSHSQILNEIQENGIKIYQFPDTIGDQEEETAANKKLRVYFCSRWAVIL